MHLLPERLLVCVPGPPGAGIPASSPRQPHHHPWGLERVEQEGGKAWCGGGGAGAVRVCC